MEETTTVKTVYIEVETLTDIIIEMFRELCIPIESLEELKTIRLERTRFLNVTPWPDYIPRLKNHLNTGKLNALQSNATTKQRFPLVNLFRQVLKCVGWRMLPQVVSQGYEASTGKKCVERFYDFRPLVLSSP